MFPYHLFGVGPLKNLSKPNILTASIDANKLYSISPCAITSLVEVSVSDVMAQLPLCDVITDDPRPVSRLGGVSDFFRADR